LGEFFVKNVRKIQQPKKESSAGKRRPQRMRGQWVVIVGNQQIIDLLEARGVSRLPKVKVTHRGQRLSFNNAFSVDFSLAKELCKICFEEICLCKDKMKAPIVVCRPSKKRRVMTPVSRRNMPVCIPAKRAA
jgi:hypothetical protein